MPSLNDNRVRATAFDWLTSQVEIHGDVLPRDLLARGFVLDEQRVPLIGPQGIFKPAVLELPLSITTAPGGPYNDAFGPDGLLKYRYRGTNPDHRDNQGLRQVMKQQIPLIYFHGIVPGKYLAAWPVYVYIVGDDPANLAVTVAVDDVQRLVTNQQTAAVSSYLINEAPETARRVYATAQVRVSLHQRAFRERVLEAYRRQCAFCRFRHQELLDAAHIMPDSHPEGEPVVRNGIALCTLHHSAFDRRFLGITPDYKIEVRPDILRKKDGPTLAHAIQALHGRRIYIPNAAALRPDRQLLAMRYQSFRRCFDGNQEVMQPKNNPFRSLCSQVAGGI